ncbi:MAG TPA: hypothetical protein VG166_08345 [Caulobacteraceae bacterium]|jgi:hypothetical protein|nr:hypothetical protein [Caulobacteraceae bacterium]
MAAFSFAYNPFVVLPVSLRATSRDVEEAYQRRLAARPQDQAALGRARTLLLEPDSRLASEVAWLIDVGPREAVALLGAMAGGNEAALLEALANQPPLTRANVAADACARLRSTAFLSPLAAAHRALDVGVLSELINQIHAAIPMPAVNPRQLDAALAAMRMLHASAAMVAISAQSDPAAALAMITDRPDAESAFVTELNSQFQVRFPPAAAAAPVSEMPHEGVPNPAEEWFNRERRTPSPITPDHEHHPGWGEGPDAHAAAAAAFMDAQIVFSAPDRFHTFGNARRVRRVLYVVGGALSAMILVYLVFGKPTDSVASDAASHPTVVAVAPPPSPIDRRHHKRECISVSGASYCTN